MLYIKKSIIITIKRETKKEKVLIIISIKIVVTIIMKVDVDN